MDTLVVYLSPEYLLTFFSNLYVPPWLRKIFNFIVLILLENAFVSQKIESIHFHSRSQEKLSPGSYYHSPGKSKLPISLRKRFLKIYFLLQQIEGTMRELKKLSKLNMLGYWSQVLINPTIFAPFPFLVYVLLCHNLDSCMLKCLDSLAHLIQFSLKRAVCKNNCMKDKSLA